jgi:hypothetical protein
VSLFDPAHPTNTWRLSGVGFTFPTNLTLGSNEVIVLVSTNPAAFRAKYGLAPEVQILGPVPGVLQDSGERIALEKPGVPNTNGIPYIVVDEVRYNDKAPWPPAADGSGPSLLRLVVTDYGNDPTNWTAALASPGFVPMPGSAPVFTTQPDSGLVLAGQSTNLTVVVTGDSVQLQWRFNGAPIPNATNSALALTNIQLAQAGTYSVLAFSPSGSAFSSNATLTVINPVFFTLQPTNQAVQPGTNVTLVAAAAGNGPVSYQWRFEGVNIPDATNASHSFINANLNQHHGNFSVIVTDAYGSVVSTNAFVYVLVRPGVVQHVIAQAVPFGANAIVTCLATGAPPITYRFFRGTTVYAVNTNGVATYSNITATTAIKVVITNLASSTVYSPGPGSLNSVNLTVAACTDCDGDGMLDSWEIAYLGGTNASPTLDTDGDGMNNRDEFRSGTIPTNALSVLKMIFSTTNASELIFVAQTNLSYSVQWRTNLVSPTWTNLTSILASPLVRTISVDSATAPAAGERYFRVVTPMAP